jgi:hypothetical protein
MGFRCATLHHGPRCHPARYLPEHALSCAEGVSMTWTCAVIQRAIEHRCIPTMKITVIVNGVHYLAGFAVQRHGSSLRHAVPSLAPFVVPLPTASLRTVRRPVSITLRFRCIPTMKPTVIVNGVNYLADCAVQRHGFSPQHGAPWSPVPSGEIPPGACPELRRRGQDDMNVRCDPSLRSG